jgi:hypothetical protein
METTPLTETELELLHMGLGDQLGKRFDEWDRKKQPDPFMASRL